VASHDLMRPSRDRLTPSAITNCLRWERRERQSELRRRGADPGVVRAQRPGLAPLRRGEMDRIEGAERHRRMTHLEDGVRTLDEIGGDRHQAETSGRHVRGDLPRRASAMRRSDRSLPLLAEECREALDDDEVRGPGRLAVDEGDVEVAVGLAYQELDENRRIQVHAAGDQSLASRSARTRRSARVPFLARPRSRARLTRNGSDVVPPSPTSLALGRPAAAITISSPAAARWSNSDKRAFALRTLAIMRQCSHA